VIDEHLDATARPRRVVQLVDLGSGAATEKGIVTSKEKPGAQSVPTCERTGEGGIDTRRQGLLAAQQSVLGGGESGDRVTRRPAGSVVLEAAKGPVSAPGS